MANGLKPHPLFLFFLLGVLIPVALCFILRPFPDPGPSVPALYSSFGFSILTFVTTLYQVPTFGPRFIQANFKGRNLLKIYSTLVYGLVCASVYLTGPLSFSFPSLFERLHRSVLQPAKIYPGLAIDEFLLFHRFIDDGQ